LDNVVLTPHLGYNVEEFFRVAYEDTLENIAAFLAGNPIRVLTAEKNFSSAPRHPA
jgi:phosphoglycerate dehydrogenase-like enzyme